MNLIEKYNFTVEEVIIFEWQFNMMGGFGKSLMQTISLADTVNLHHLSKAFPNHVQAFRSWAHGNMWNQLTMKLDENPEVFARFKL